MAIGFSDPKNLDSSHRVHKERNGSSMFCRFTPKVIRNFAITVCLSSVISVADYVFKADCISRLHDSVLGLRIT